MRKFDFFQTTATALLTAVMALAFTTDVAARTLSLQSPGEEGASFLQAEAGISAYTNVKQAIDLTKAKGAFRTIERETDEYIIGSVPLPDYPETEDVHAYIHKDGWIVTYYLKEEPAAKIVDWNNYGGDEEIKGTKLEVGIIIVVNTVEVSVKDIKYYDFRYPDANKLMIVADGFRGERTKGEDTFRLKLPSDFVFYERSFSFFVKETPGYCLRVAMHIDVEEISKIGYPESGTVTKHGQLSPLQLSLGEFHTIKITTPEDQCPVEEAFGAIILIYQEP